MNLFGLTNQEWLDIGISFAILVGALIFVRPLLNFIFDRVIKKLTRFTKTGLDDAIITALRGPLFWLVFVLAFQFSVERLDFLTDGLAFDFQNLYFVLFSIVSFVSVWRLINSLTHWYGKEIAPKTESDLDNQLAPFLRRIALILTSIIAAIIVLGYFDIEVSGLVATLGIGSLAVALAAQAALADTISGFMIMFDRPFRIGDRIEIQELDTWGDVVDIGLSSTRIRTRDNRMVIIPNSVIGKSMIVNYAYPDTQYRIEIEIGVAYGTDLEYARKTIIDAVKDVDGVLPDRKVEALFLQFGDSSMIFRVRWWIESYVDTRRMFDKVNTAMYNALEKAGIKLPYPQQEIHLKIDPEDLPHFSKALGRK